MGDFLKTPIRINDHRLIKEFTSKERVEILSLIQELGQKSADLVYKQLNQVQTQSIIVATHVPPFRQSTWYQDRCGDWDWMPDFCCGAMGNMLMEYASTHPHQNLYVYCGHSHGQGAYFPLKNLSIFTGKAEYEAPQLQGVIDSLGCVNHVDQYQTAT